MSVGRHRAPDSEGDTIAALIALVILVAFGIAVAALIVATIIGGR